MPDGICGLTRGLILLLTIAINSSLQAQQLPPVSTRPSSFIQHRSTLENTVNKETECSNGIDDDNNGLTDAKDFHCYFTDPQTMDECRPTKIIWASTNWGLHWIDIETNEQRLIASRDAHTYDDITWGANGKLYGAERGGGIYEIDPYTLESALVGNLGEYYYANAMTADASGYLYLGAFKPGGECDIVKYNPATNTLEVVVTLVKHGTSAAGDMCFLNGYLYVTCLGMKLAKIDIKKKTITMMNIIDCPILDGPYGMTTLGDGYLYISDNHSGIYRLDPNTLRATFYREIDHPNLTVLGYTSYSDICNSNPCKATVKISTDKFPPYCANEGVLLTAEGKNMKGTGAYAWTLPDRGRSNSNVVKAWTSGTYYVNYYDANHDCEVADSIVLNISDAPYVNLGKDTFVCTDGKLKLLPAYNAYVSEFHWDDNSNLSSREIKEPGKYWVEVVNHCGIDADTITVTQRARDKVFIGNDTAICKYDAIELKNVEPIDRPTSFKWNSGETTQNVIADKPGRYVLDVTTVCGIESDTLIVTEKIDGCECFLYVPNAFTPNHDNKNDAFSVQSNCKIKGTLQVFNRWGGLVYSTAELHKGWNGYVGSQMQPSGMYVYHIIYEYVNRPGKFSRKGTIMLVR